MSTTLIYVLAAVMVVVGIGFIFIIVRPNDRPAPKGAVQWAGTVMSGMLIALAVALVVLAFQIDRGQVNPGAMAPLAGSTEADAPASNFAFHLIGSDEEVELDDYRGQVVLLNFWATWCAPCLDELPDLNQLHATYADQGLTVITISDEDPATIKDFSEEEIALETVSGYITDPERLPQPFFQMLTGRPMTYIIDRQGTVRQIILGQRDYAAFETMVVPLLMDELAHYDEPAWSTTTRAKNKGQRTEVKSFANTDLHTSSFDLTCTAGPSAHSSAHVS